MTDELDLDQIERTEGGKGLRARLEAVLSERAQERAELATLRAEKAIAANGWTHVKPEDIAGLEADEIATKGAELNEQRKAAEEEIVRNALASRGLDPDTVLSAEVVTNEVINDQSSAWATGRSVVGTPVSRMAPSFEGLSGPALIEAALEAKATK